MNSFIFHSGLILLEVNRNSIDCAKHIISLLFCGDMFVTFTFMSILVKSFTQVDFFSDYKCIL